MSLLRGSAGIVSGVNYDAVVVGAGPNGLVGALTLARAGRRVLLVEATGRVGGAMRTEELTLPGFRHDVGAAVVPLALASPAMRGLGLPDSSWAHPPVPLAHPLDDGAAVVHRSVDATARGLGRDAAVWRALVGHVAAAGDRLVDALLSPLSIGAAARAALPLTRFGTTGLLPASVLGRLAFRTDAGRALFAGLCGHAVLPLRALSTSGYGVLLGGLAHRVGWPVVRGGTSQLAEALATRLTAAGGEIVTGTPVRTLADLPPAPITLLDLTPRQVLAVAGDRLPDRYRARLARYRYGPGVCKLDWALDGPVPWRDPAVRGAGTVHLGGTFAELARSELDVARGRHPERPYVLCVQPSVADPSRAPEGKHVLWAYCHVPNGSTRDMTAAVEAQVERFAPGFGELVLARHVLTASALEAFDANLVGGDIGGGAADLRQFVARPTLSAHPWATPVRGLYICSSSTPPGGGVHGMGGRHAAELAMRRD
ncbi:MAG: phytoene desaturase family protein [Jatrophihabitantaceae bacterium]